ncbi:MAG: flagellar export chaperone FlgN [Firmicutes bacterium]|nr:flagellar export chaperone FlgN [Candidatus Fermentithermobacillaceae bacterium]
MSEVSKIIPLLEEILALLQNLLSLASRQMNVLVYGNVVEIQDINAKQEAILEQLKELEEKRLSIISSCFEGDPSSITLSRLYPHLDPAEQARLSVLADRLNTTSACLKVLGKRNQELARRSLEIVQKELSLLLPEQSYQPTGEKKVMKSLVLDRKT